jgi:hypothetical protein
LNSNKEEIFLKQVHIYRRDERIILYYFTFSLISKGTDL